MAFDRWGNLYEQRWGYRHTRAQKNPALAQQVEEDINEVRTRTRFAHLADHVRRPEAGEEVMFSSAAN
jgi:hypothetical protein